ncbi:MAG: hypothetical protein V7K18_06940 [Nostoc sp.]|uniref:hypothetical protein n=1 Tax=Nostoc sp. TaxID=1180 RepID=UPI002FF54D82
MSLRLFFPFYGLPNVITFAATWVRSPFTAPVLVLMATCVTMGAKVIVIGPMVVVGLAGVAGVAGLAGTGFFFFQLPPDKLASSWAVNVVNNMLSIILTSRLIVGINVT